MRPLLGGYARLSGKSCVYSNLSSEDMPTVPVDI